MALGVIVVPAIALWIHVAHTASNRRYADFLGVLATLESSGKPSAVNRHGYAGLYQMGEAALIEAGYYKRDKTPGKNDWRGAWTGKNGIYSLTEFLRDTPKQDQAISNHHENLWHDIQTLNLGEYIGKTIAGVTITESGLIAGAHLVGTRGLKRFLRSNGRSIPKDGNGTPITKYIRTFAGYDIDVTLSAWRHEGRGHRPGGGLRAADAAFVRLRAHWGTAGLTLIAHAI